MTAGARPGGAVVIQTAHLGDVVLTLPLLQVLARRYGPVDVITTPAAAPLLLGQPAVREVLPFDKRADDGGPAGLWRLATRLRARRYASAWLPHRSLRSGLLALLAAVPQRVGFAGSPGQLGYTRRVRLPDIGHQTARLAALAGADPPPPPWFAISPAAAATAARWLEAGQLRAPFAVLAPGARWGTKRWPFYAELAASLRLSLVVVGGTEDRALGEQIVIAARGRSANAAGVLDLPASAAVIARSALVISNDSLPLHLASGLGRPAVALFGPTVPAFGFGPLGATDRVVDHPDLSCRPCSPHGPMHCPLGHHRCMRELAVDLVCAAVEARLGEAGAEGAGATGRPDAGR
jgi:heptosyltransferase-2